MKGHADRLTVETLRPQSWFFLRFFSFFLDSHPISSYLHGQSKIPGLPTLLHNVGIEKEEITAEQAAMS